MKTIYISDLDGTLLNNQACLSDKTRKTLNRLISEGMPFTYATARSWNSAHGIMTDVCLSLPIITYNGTFIVDPGTGGIIESASFDDEQRDFIIDTLISHKLCPLIYTILDGVERVLWMKGKETVGISGYLLARAGDKRFMAIDSPRGLKTGRVFYVTIIGSETELSFLVDIFGSNGYKYNFQKDTYKDEFWFEIYPRDASKSGGVRKLKSMLQMEKTVCFGDNLNDIPMFEISDECYAVANAHEGLKKIATGVIPCNTDDGVAMWLLERWHSN